MKAPSPKGFGTALKTLTRIPWPFKEDEAFSASLSWFPVVGLLLGLILYGISLPWDILPVPRWPEMVALLMVVAEAWITRGLHLDGLADWADSMGSFRGKEKRLSIMKDSSLGAFGGLVLIMALLAKWIAFERLFASGSTVWLLAIFVISRDMLVELMTTLPYARNGEGTAKPFVDQASKKQRMVSHILSLLLCAPFGPLALILLGAAFLETRIFRTRCRIQFGGITGDLLGTAAEMVEISLLIVCAFPGRNILIYTGWDWLI
ncbi:MAG: adenosylcobinamide-GDP ribazoletransferase [Desulfobacteraceae bacterium]|nr:adenosylcobinamide-GDP ribazoletransferase [Desulfobacteraceae bacterium]